MANGHAELSPSSAERWMTCPGSVILSEGLPDSSSEYADEGTAAHFLAQHCLETGDHPASYIGYIIEVPPDGPVHFGDASDPNVDISWYPIDADFAASVNSYVQYVRSVVEATGGTLLVEQRLDISFLTGEEDAEGTSDAVILTGTELIVVDLKFGRGVEVDADGNKQLQIYALAALREFEMLGDFDRVRLVIHQPRLGHVSEWDCAVSELRDFQDEVSKAAVRVHAIKLIADDIRIHQEDFAEVFAPAEKGCKWCKAKANCHALAGFVQDAIEADFEDLTQRESIPVLQGSGRFEDDDKELSVKMQACDLIEQWISAVRAEVERRLIRGVPVPGYKLVQGKKGNRQWDDAATAEQTLKGMKIKVEDMYDMKVISPTTAEKLFKAGTIGPRQWPKVEAMIVQKDGKPSVAPESDKRPALVVDKPEDDFEDLTGGLPDLI